MHENCSQQKCLFLFIAVDCFIHTVWSLSLSEFSLFIPALERLKEMLGLKDLQVSPSTADPAEVLRLQMAFRSPCSSLDDGKLKSHF